MRNISTAIARELLDYDPDIGVFTWRERGREWFRRDHDWKVWNKRFAGQRAGCVNRGSSGYPWLSIRLQGAGFRASRLAFIWMGEDLPEQVDHWDRDSLNNRWSNLVASNQVENGKNKSMSRRNSSGLTGVYWNKAAGKWLTLVMVNKKRHYLGYFTNKNEAGLAVAKFRKKHGFSDDHGKELPAYAEVLK